MPSWDLSHVHLVDERTGNVLCRLFPQDKTQNASGLRRALDPAATATPGRPNVPSRRAAAPEAA